MRQAGLKGKPAYVPHERGLLGRRHDGGQVKYGFFFLLLAIAIGVTAVRGRPWAWLFARDCVCRQARLWISILLCIWEAIILLPGPAAAAYLAST